MRGSDSHSGSLFSYVNLDERIPARHPLRKIKGVVDAARVWRQMQVEGKARLYVPSPPTKRCSSPHKAPRKPITLASRDERGASVDPWESFAQNRQIPRDELLTVLPHVF